ncbi:carbohydrate ABC transporter permease [Salana multivorans]
MTQTAEVQPPVPASTLPKPRQDGVTSKGQAVTASWMIAPAVLLISLFVIVPIALTFALAFTNARLVSPSGPSFIGLDNFSRLLSDPLFWQSLRNTVIFAVVVVPV